MKIILSGIEKDLIKSWNKFCSDLDFVEVRECSILDVECDAVVSPANSFGFMDGGIDYVYSQFFGWHVQERLKYLIQTEHHGELLVGQSEIVNTDHPKIPYLISSPTMRVPTILKDSVNPYLATRGTLLLVKNGVFKEGSLKGKLISNTVETIAFPGLGTGVGDVHPDICALQMRIAFEDVILDKREFPNRWIDVQTQHQLLYRNFIKDLQKN